MPKLTVDGKIASIFDDFRIAVNVGSDHGVTPGDVVHLYKEVEVVDPDSSEVLGMVRIDKAALKVSEVQARMSIAEVPYDRSADWSTSVFANVLNVSRRKVRLREEGARIDAATDVSVAIGEPVSVSIKASGDQPF